MPIIDIQRRLREAGRIRLGERVPTSNGKSRPSKLSAFRFTSQDERSLRLVASAYGGDVQEWDGSAVGKCWELYTDSTDLDVIVPPVALAWSQWMEEWSGAVCRHRCDGQTDVKMDASCSCDPDGPICKPTSRLGVILTAVEGIGVWRLETHGWAAATELNGAIEVLSVIQNRGAMVPARLLLEQRQSKKIDQAGKAATMNFAVPVLDLHLSVAALVGGGVAPPVPLEPGVVPVPTSLEPIPSVAEQAIAVQQPPERPKRKNAAATLPPTGIRPRAVTAVSSVTDRTAGGASAASLRKLMATCRGNKAVPDEDEARYEWAAIALNHPVKSFNDLDQKEVSQLIDIASGKAPLIPDHKVKDTDNDPERPF